MNRRSFMELLVIPWVDKTIAMVASLPFAIELYRPLGSLPYELSSCRSRLAALRYHCHDGAVDDLPVRNANP